MNSQKPSNPSVRRNIFIAIGVVAVLAVVFFNQQIGQLLNLFGSRAETLETGEEAPSWVLSPFYFDNYEYLQRGLIIGKNFVGGIDYDVAVETATDTFETFAVARKLAEEEIPSFLELADGKEVLEFSILPYTQLPASGDGQLFAISPSGTDEYYPVYDELTQFRQRIFLLPASLHNENAIKLSRSDHLHSYPWYPPDVPIGALEYVYSRDQAYKLWRVELNPPPADLEIPIVDAVFFNRDSGHLIPMAKKAVGVWPTNDPNIDPGLNQLAMIGHDVGQLRVFRVVDSYQKVLAYDVSDNYDSDYTAATDLDEDEFFSVLPVVILQPQTGDELLKSSSASHSSFRSIQLGVSLETFQPPTTGKVAFYADQIGESTAEPVAGFYIGSKTIVCWGGTCDVSYDWPVGYWWGGGSGQELPDVFTSDWQIRGVVQGYLGEAVVDSARIIKSGVFKIVEELSPPEDPQVSLDITASLQYGPGADSSESTTAYLDIYKGATKLLSFEVAIQNGHSANPVIIEPGELSFDTSYAAYLKTDQHLSRKANETIEFSEADVDSETNTVAIDLTFPELRFGDIWGTGASLESDVRDDIVDVLDWTRLLNELTGHWLTSVADFNRDGYIDVLDAIPFIGTDYNYGRVGEAWDLPD